FASNVAEYSEKCTFFPLTAPSAVHLAACFLPDSQHRRLSVKASLPLSPHQRFSVLNFNEFYHDYFLMSTNFSKNFYLKLRNNSIIAKAKAEPLRFRLFI
ncbi:MAG: hypothetical protein IKD83_00130, partial [Firmicutes bacterium]|nr:hypothetical protein [Bacillota bacterium]